MCFVVLWPFKIPTLQSQKDFLLCALWPKKNTTKSKEEATLLSNRFLLPFILQPKFKVLCAKLPIVKFHLHWPKSFSKTTGKSFSKEKCPTSCQFLPTVQCNSVDQLRQSNNSFFAQLKRLLSIIFERESLYCKFTQVAFQVR